jgi:hypothetical protein
MMRNHELSEEDIERNYVEGTHSDDTYQVYLFRALTGNNLDVEAPLAPGEYNFPKKDVYILDNIPPLTNWYMGRAERISNIQAMAGGRRRRKTRRNKKRYHKK